MWVCNICVDIERRAASLTKPVCHMACAGTSHKCPLSYPSLAAFDNLAVAVPFPSCHYFWQIIIKMTLSQFELLSHGQTYAHTLGDCRHRTHNTHNCLAVMKNTHTSHRVNSRLKLNLAVWWMTGWNVKINGYLYFIMILFWPQNKVSLSGRCMSTPIRLQI